MKNIPLTLTCLAAILVCPRTFAQHTPVQDGSLYAIEVSNIRFEVDAEEGAKVSSFTLGEEEFMVTSTMVSSYFLWGATLWPSPQSEWAWTPENFHWDHHAYEAAIKADTMVFTGPDAAVDNGDRFHFVKRFWANPEDSTISLNYTMVNTSGESIRKGLWELTRVPVGGLSFWPTGPGGCWGQLSSATEEAIGHTWYLRESQDGTNLKFFADGSEGWFAHVDDQRRLYIKTFEDVDPADFAPGEGEIELWVAPEYIELENQGHCMDIPADDSLVYELKWYLRELPPGIEATVGNLALVDYVNAVISGEPWIPDGIGETILGNQMELYPNPTDRILQLRIHGDIPSEARYELYNSLGQKLQSGPVHNGMIDLSEQSAGIYLLKVSSGGQTQVGHVMKRQ